MLSRKIEQEYWPETENAEVADECSERRDDLESLWIDLGGEG